VYEDLAAQNSGADRNRMLLRAARDYLAVKRTDEAARALGGIEGQLSPEDAQERALSNVELALDRGQAQDAARQLHLIAVPAAGAAAARYHDLQARLAGLPATPGAGPAASLSAEAAPHIALLLPLTGRANGAAVSVRDGFMTAYFQAPARERPRVRIYDTGTQSVSEALSQAARQGADFIVGPLTREEVTAAADYPGQRAALLALNFLPPERPAPAQFYQYALSPEDEARLAARRVLEDHHRRGVALVPSGDWGVRVLTAFKQELQATIESGRTDYAAAITEVLRLSDSTARWHRLESVLGTKLQFEPRRRNDIQFIFSPAQANIERLLRPQLRFHYAGDIPTYATSDAYEPDSRANEDLDGLMFPDMPWMLGGDLADAVRATTHDAWPSGGPYRGRLFA
jgi:outer membrane PBP1 activator LpoA protein